MHEVGIVGGGFLGSALAQTLHEPVRVTTRSGRWPHGDPPPGIEMAALDVITSSPATIRGALRGVDALVVCVAPGRTQDRRELYVEGTRHLLEATRTFAWRRIVYVGSTSALPDRDAWLDETTVDLPHTERGLVQRDAETLVAEHCEALDIPWLVLRLGGLYGPTRPIGRIYGGRDRRGDAPLPGDGNVPTNLVHLHDAVQATAAAVHAPPNVRGIVHVCDDDHTPRRTMYARAGARVRWEKHAHESAPPRGKRVSNLRMKSVLGVRLLHPTHR